MKEIGLWLLLLLILAHITPQYGEVGITVTFITLVVSFSCVMIGALRKK